MTTEHPPPRAGPARSGDPAERGERLEQLRRRRSTAPAPDTRPGGGGPGPVRRTKRAHAAAGGRILTAGLSAAGALALVGVMAGHAQPASQVTSTDAPVVVVVRRPTSGSPASTDAGAVPAVTATVAPPVSTSQAS
jgi:hypothetical protein